MGLRLIAGALLMASAMFGQEGSYQNADVRGSYIFSFNGVLLQGTQAIPVSAIGRFTADGGGKITSAARTLNMAGQVIQQSFTGDYQVNADGTGTASFLLISQAPAGPPVRETFSFALSDRKNGELLGLALSITGPNGEILGLSPITNIRILSQK